MCNIDPTIYGHIMLEREQAEQLYNIKRMEIAFEEYKKRVKTIEEQERTDKKGENGKMENANKMLRDYKEIIESKMLMAADKYATCNDQLGVGKVYLAEAKAYDDALNVLETLKKQYS